MKRILFTLIASSAMSTLAFGQSESWVFDNSGNDDYTLTSVSNTSIFSGSLPASDPVLTIVMGTRYTVTVVNSLAHPFQVLAKGASSAQDIVLLSQGAAGGSLEADVGINWQDDGQGLNGVVSFTVTQTLVDAFTQSGLIAGYKCRLHPTMMRGDFNVTVPMRTIPDIAVPRGGGFIEEGDTATLTATVSNAQNPTTFAWYKDGSGTPLPDGGNISGAESPALVISSVTTADSGSYVLEVTDSAKSISLSSPIPLTVVGVGALPIKSLASFAAVIAILAVTAALYFRRRKA